MSAYTVNEDNLFFDEKTIVCLQKLDRIYQLRLMTLYAHFFMYKRWRPLKRADKKWGRGAVVAPMTLSYHFWGLTDFDSPQKKTQSQKKLGLFRFKDMFFKVLWVLTGANYDLSLAFKTLTYVSWGWTDI